MAAKIGGEQQMNGHWWTERVWPGFVGGVILLILLLVAPVVRPEERASTALVAHTLEVRAVTKDGRTSVRTVTVTSTAG